MATEGKWVNDPDQLDQLIQKVYCRVPVILHTKEKEQVPAQIERLGPCKIAIKSNAQPGSARILAARLQDGLILLECIPEGTLPDGREVCHAKRLHRTLRKEPRTEIGQNRLIVTGVIPSRQIPEYMASGDLRRDNFLGVVERELKSSLGEAQIFLRKTVRLDFRMRAMQTGCRSILFSPETVSPDERFVPWQEYEQILSYDKLPKGIVSEISVGLFYKKNFIYGYIRAFSHNTFTLTEFDQVSAMARKVEKFIEDSGMLPSNPEKCVVLDLSMSGAGILHPQSQIVMQKFMPGEPVLMDIHFPGGPLNFSASIRNIRSLENAHRLGIEFDTLDETRQAALEAALGTGTKTEPAAQGASADTTAETNQPG